MDEKLKIAIRPIDSVLVDDKENLISKYLIPNPNCICCNIPEVSIRINQAYLSGKNYTSIVSEFSDIVESKIGRKLDTKTLSTHFTEHFNYKGVAIAEYNRRHGMDNLVPAERKELTTIFSALVEDKINDLEILDLAMKEQIKRLKELEDLKKQKIDEGRTFNIDQLIMKQEAVADNISKNILGKLQIWQKARLQTKQIEIMDRQLQFLDHKTASFLGIDSNAMQKLGSGFANEVEKLYLKVVIESLIARTKKALDVALSLNAQDKTHFFKELNRQFKGIDKDINEQFGEKVKNFQNLKT